MLNGFRTPVSLSPPFSSSRGISSRQPHYRLGQVRVALSPPEKNKPRSSLSDQTGIVSLGVSLASGLRDFPTITLDLHVGEQPRVGEVSIVHDIDMTSIVHDIEMTSIVQLHSLGGSPKQSVSTQNVELTRPVSGFFQRPKHGR